MCFTKAIVVALLGLLAETQAAKLQSRAPSGLSVVKTEPQANGATLTFYGDAHPSRRDASQAANSNNARDLGCGTNRIKCSAIYAYDGPLCEQLFTALQGNLWINQNPRAVCLGQGSDQCCIGWSENTVSSMPEMDLLPSARRVWAECGNGWSLSGQEWNVLLGGTCVSQCLSNRPEGCTS